MSMLAAISRTTRIDTDRLIVLGMGLVIAIPLFVFVAYPLLVVFAKSFITPSGAWGIANYIEAFSTSRFWGVVYNSFEVSIAVTVLAILFGFAYAYALQRAELPLKAFFGVIATVPLFAPSLVQALGLVFLMGRNGLINQYFGTDLDIYGFWGILISDTIYAFPQAFLVFSAALSAADGRLYEAAKVMGAGRVRIFFHVTLPSIRYGTVSAIFLVFTITITDFGNPMVIGGNYSVLATEIYNQVSGQMNFNLGAVIAIILLIPTAGSFAVMRWMTKAQYAVVSEQAQPLVPDKEPLVDGLLLSFVALIAAIILLVVGVVIWASFVKLWPYNLSLTFNNYIVDVQGGWAPLWTSIEASLMAAVLGVVMVIGGAYVIHKVNNNFTKLLNALSILPAAVPGMVLGLAYVFAFNTPDNPVYIIYDTVILLAIINMYHYHAQGYLTANTSFKQISHTFDEASTCLGANFFETMRRVTLPMIMPTVLSVGVFFFMRSMVTLAAVIFLVTPKVQLAAVSVMLLDDAGNITQAAAFSTAIIGVVLAALVSLRFVLRLFGVESRSFIS